MGTCGLKSLPFEASCVLAVYLQFESCAFCHPTLCGLNKKQKEQISSRLQSGWKSAVKITFSLKTFEVPEKRSFPNGTSIENVLLYMPSRLSYLHTAV